MNHSTFFPYFDVNEIFMRVEKICGSHFFLILMLFSCASYGFGDIFFLVAACMNSENLWFHLLLHLVTKYCNFCCVNKRRITLIRSDRYSICRCLQSTGAAGLFSLIFFHLHGNGLKFMHWNRQWKLGCFDGKSEIKNFLFHFYSLFDSEHWMIVFSTKKSTSSCVHSGKVICLCNLNVPFAHHKSE